MSADVDFGRRASRSLLVKLTTAAALLLLLRWYTPAADSRFPLCGFHWLTGLRCPLCGLTHAMFCLAKGHIREALGYNALSPLAFLMLFGLWWEGRLRGHLWTAGIAAFGVYGVIRIFVAGA